MRRAYSRNHSGSRTHVRNDAGAANVAMPRTRSSSAAVTIASVPPRRKPAIHTPVTSARASSASTAARTSASQPSIEKSPSDGPVPRNVNVSPAQPASRAMRSHKVGSVLPSAAAPPAPRGNPGSTSSAGTRVDARRAREVRTQPQPFRDDLLHRRDSSPTRELVVGILTRVSASTQITPSTAAAPALKEWAAIVHALLEGEQVIDVRKGGLREDGRHFDVTAAPRCWLYPTAEHQKRRAAEARLPRTGSISPTASPVGEPITIAGWADIVDVATITEPEHLDAIASKLIWTDDYAESRLKWKKRDPLWVLVLRAHRLDEPITVPWDEAYGGCTSWVDLGGLPADPATAAVAPRALRRRVRVEAEGRARVAPRGMLAEVARATPTVRAGAAALRSSTFSVIASGTSSVSHAPNHCSCDRNG